MANAVTRTLQSEAGRGLTLVSPAFLYALLLLAAPLATIVLFSFWTQQFLTIDRTFTFSNYQEALTDPLYRTLMLRSLVISAAVTATTVILAFPIAYFISFRVQPRHKSLWLFLITIPFWTSYLIRVFLWRVILAFDGPVNGSLMTLGVIDQPLPFILYNPVSVVITLSHAFAPFAILPIFVSLEKIDRSLIEAARDLGESRAMTFLRVTLPLAMPGILGAIVIVFIPTIGDYVTPRLVGGANGTMISNMIYAQIFDLQNRPMGATLAVVAMVAVVLSLLWGATRLRAWVWIADRFGGGYRGFAAVIAIAGGEVLMIWGIFTHAPAVIGPIGTIIFLVVILGFLSLWILFQLPRGKLGI